MQPYTFAMIFLCSLLPQILLADTVHPSAGQSWAGQIRHIKVKQNIQITDIAEKESIGLDAITAANPGTHLARLKAGTQLMLPTMYLLPSIQKGIVINLPEKRLYYFQSPNTVHVFPVAIGKVHRISPLGTFTITEKRYQPIWTVPASILKEEHNKGNHIPPIFPPGPENPLGNHAMRLSHGSILIHGTNFAPGVGKRSTTGCFSMYPNDIAALYEMVPTGTSVTIINEPIKTSHSPYGILIETHPTLAQTSNHSFRSPTQSEIKANVESILQRYPQLDPVALTSIFTQNMGVPIPAEKKHASRIHSSRSTPRR